MSNEFGMKELYSVFLKTTYPMRIHEKEFEEGEIIAAFDKIQIANFQEIKAQIEARGGFDNRAHVIWQSTKEVDFVFQQGIFSKDQFALLSGANLVKTSTETVLTERQRVETDEEGKFELKNLPYENFFIYTPSGDKIPRSRIIRKKKEVQITDSAYEELICDYDFLYNGKVSELVIGQELVKGYLSLEARTRVKDDITGHTRTGIIKIPQLKLMSDLSMRLGDNAPPLMGTFKAAGYPVGSRGDTKVMEILFLEDDIDSDF